jgi:hypothetical protein
MPDRLLDEGRCGSPVITVTSSKYRRYIGRGVAAAIFLGYLSRINNGIASKREKAHNNTILYPLGRGYRSVRSQR